MKGREENWENEPMVNWSLLGMNLVFLHPEQEQVLLHLFPSRWQGQ